MFVRCRVPGRGFWRVLLRALAATGAIVAAAFLLYAVIGLLVRLSVQATRAFEYAFALVVLLLLGWRFFVIHRRLLAAGVRRERAGVVALYAFLRPLFLVLGFLPLRFVRSVRGLSGEPGGAGRVRGGRTVVLGASVGVLSGALLAGLVRLGLFYRSNASVAAAVALGGGFVGLSLFVGLALLGRRWIRSRVKPGAGPAASVGASLWALSACLFSILTAGGFRTAAALLGIVSAAGAVGALAGVLALLEDRYLEFRTRV